LRSKQIIEGTTVRKGQGGGGGTKKKIRSFANQA